MIFHWWLRLLSVVWYILCFGFILPVTLLLITVSLDQLAHGWFGVGLAPNGFLLAASMLFGLAGLVLLGLSTMALHREGKGWPWSFGSHAAFNPQHLVTSGPYAYVRHPMGSAYLLFLIAVGCLVPSLTLLLWIVPLAGGLLYEYFGFTEEKRLRHWFGDEYEAYHSRTASLLPRLGTRL